MDQGSKKGDGAPGTFLAIVGAIASIAGAYVVGRVLNSTAAGVGLLVACALGAAADAVRRRGYPGLGHLRDLHLEAKGFVGLTVVLALAALGIAVFYNPAGPPPPTKKILYVPPLGEVSNGGLRLPRAPGGGVCVHSQFDPYPEDAYRCIRRDVTLDPCFVSEVLEFAQGEEEGLPGGVLALVCPITPPWIEHTKSFHAIQFHPSHPLLVSSAELAARSPRWAQPLALELEGQIHCIRQIPSGFSPSKATTKYECVGANGGHVGSVIGFPNEGALFQPLRTWTVEYVHSGNQGTAGETKDVLRAWE